MLISVAPHKVIPLILAPVLAITVTMSKSGPNFTSYDEPGPRSNCYVKVDDPHISKYYLKKGQERVKVNARSVCSHGHRHVNLSVEIWKDGRVGSNFVGIFSTNPLTFTSITGLVEIKNASVKCKNRKPTKYFAYAYGKAEIEGKKSRTPVAVTDHVVLRCGT